MKAVLCTRFAGLDQLTVEEVASPPPGPGQVKLDIKAAALNFSDALIVQGAYQFKPPLPFIPGSEFAGVITEVGPGVTDYERGDRVFAFRPLGGFAEESVVDTSHLVRLPEAMDFDVGAGLMMTYGTSLRGLKDCANLKAGETLLVLGASGGVGIAAVELGKAMGARVIAAASTDEKLALCRRHGADDTINYAKDDLRERIAALTAGEGIDVVYDPVGGPYAEQALRATRWRGRLLVIGFASGEIPKIPVNLCLLKERSVMGVYWGDSLMHDPASHQRNVAQLLAWFASKKIKPHIDIRVPLTDVPKLMERMLARQISGKAIVLPETGSTADSLISH